MFVVLNADKGNCSLKALSERWMIQNSAGVVRLINCCCSSASVLSLPKYHHERMYPVLSLLDSCDN